MQFDTSIDSKHLSSSNQAKTQFEVSQGEVSFLCSDFHIQTGTDFFEGIHIACRLSCHRFKLRICKKERKKTTEFYLFCLNLKK